MLDTLPIALDITTATSMIQLLVARDNSLAAVACLCAYTKAFPSIQRWLKKWRIKANQDQCTSTSNSERSENFSSWRCQIFRTTCRAWTKLEEKIYSPSENNLNFTWAKCAGYSTQLEDHNYRMKTSCYYQTYSDLWLSIVEHGLQFKYRNITKINKYLRIMHHLGTMYHQW